MYYTIKKFRSQFPTDDACLEYLFKNRYGSHYKCPVCGKTKFYRIKNRKCFNCACGYQIHPVAGTIFHKSATKLSDWFFAIYLLSNSKNGVSAKELQRHLGTTYKTAWRIAKQVRSLMKQGGDKLDGTVEADETYIGGRKKGKRGYSEKIPVMGMVQRGGKIKLNKVSDNSTYSLLKELKENVRFGSKVITDDAGAYKGKLKLMRLGLFHKVINHSKQKYVKGDIYTNTIEGFFSQLKRSMDGTHHHVSPKHLQSYVDEFAFHYNQRLSSVSAFETLLSRLCGQQGSTGGKIPSSVVVGI